MGFTRGHDGAYFGAFGPSDFVGEIPVGPPTILTVRTTGATETFQLPFRDGYAYDCTVDWGDGTVPDDITAWNDAALLHEYATADDYDITITGLAESLYFWNTGAAQTQLSRHVAPASCTARRPSTQLWNYGVMELWNECVLLFYALNDEIMELWNYGVME